MSLHRTLAQNDSERAGVVATADNESVQLFNLSTLSNNDLLPDELPNQVCHFFRVSHTVHCAIWVTVGHLDQGSCIWRSGRNRGPF